jgi:hypothetical protein
MRPLLKGWCHHGLYTLPPKIMRRHAFRVVKPSLARCHSQLGHLSPPIVRKVISKNNPPYSSESNNE